MYLEGITNNYCRFKGRATSYNLGTHLLRLEIKELNYDYVVSIDMSKCPTPSLYVGNDVIVEAKAMVDENGNNILKWHSINYDQTK